MPDKTFYITTAIAYANSVPHLGHAMEFIEVDAIARYKRNMGFDAFVLTGTDEHGIKNYNAAKEAGMEPKPFVDKNAKVFRSLWEILNLDFQAFVQTSDREVHWPAAQKMWKKLDEAGDLYRKEYEGLYCEGCERFIVERELVDGNCPDHKRPPKPMKENNYFFKLSKYTEQIIELIESDTVKIYPEFRKHEFLNMAKEGLHDVSFSRTRELLPWGVDVPGDDDQVMYVWCDALTTYISGIDYAEDGDKWKKYWPGIHAIGKDIVRFHAGIWLGMLLSAKDPLPEGIFVHGFLTHNGEKMSKTVGNVVDPIETAETYGSDALRYYLLREIPVGRDGDFNDKLFIERYNSDLANNLGNLVNRVHTLVTRNDITDFAFDKGGSHYKEKVEETWKKYKADMDELNLHEAVFHVWRLVDFANKMMEEEKPWATIKTDPEAGEVTLVSILEVIRHVTMMIEPFIPTSAGQIRLQIGLEPGFDLEKEGEWGSQIGWSSLGEGGIIFPRIETEE